MDPCEPRPAIVVAERNAPIGSQCPGSPGVTTGHVTLSPVWIGIWRKGDGRLCSLHNTSPPLSFSLFLTTQNALQAQPEFLEERTCIQGCRCKFFASRSTKNGAFATFRFAKANLPTGCFICFSFHASSLVCSICLVKFSILICQGTQCTRSIYFPTPPLTSLSSRCSILVQRWPLPLSPLLVLLLGTPTFTVPFLSLVKYMPTRQQKRVYMPRIILGPTTAGWTLSITPGASRLSVSARKTLVNAFFAVFFVATCPL